MDQNTIGLILLFAAAATVGLFIVLVSSLIGRRHAPKNRNIPYECGLDPVGKPHKRFAIKYFLIAVLFIIFDVEVVFMYPWAIAFKDSLKTQGGMFLALEMVVFFVIVGLALIYAWGKGALEWEE